MAPKGLTLLALALSLGLSLAVEARPGHDRGPSNVQKMLEELKLTDQQKTKIDGIRKAFKDKAKGMRKSVNEAEKALDEAMTATASKSTLLKKFDAVESARAKLRKARFQMMLDVREALTAEQRKAFKMSPKQGKMGGGQPSPAEEN